MRGGGPLAGTQVVEAAVYVSGPFAGLMLADLGAEVVKVEPLRGDPFRRFGLVHGGVSAAWLNVNHGKRCVFVDLKSDEGRGELASLLSTADVFLHNWRPGVAESLGFGADDVCGRHPRLVYAGISGFGPDGPRSAAPVFDSLVQASVGLASYEAVGAEPTILRSFLADKTVAAFAVQAVLAALLERDRTGQGARLDIAMLDSLAYFDFPDLAQDRTFLDPAAATDLRRGRSPRLTTADGHIVVAPVSGAQIAAAVTAVGHPEWIAELKQITSPPDLTDRLFALLETETRRRSTAACEQAFVEHDVPVAVVLGLDEHFADPQTVHNELYRTDAGPNGPIRRVRHPMRIDGEVLRSTAVAEPVPSPRSEATPR